MTLRNVETILNLEDFQTYRNKLQEKYTVKSVNLQKNVNVSCLLRYRKNHYINLLYTYFNIDIIFC